MWNSKKCIVPKPIILKPPRHMKFNLLLILLLPVISISQTFVGQPIYTEAQRQEFKQRFSIGPYKFRATGSFGAYDGTFQKIIDGKNDSP